LGRSKEGLEEMGRIRKTIFIIGEEKIEKLTVFTKEQKEILKNWVWKGTF